MNDDGAKRLIASILKQAYEDYCENKTNDKNHCDAKKFIHSAWCASLCDGVEVDYNKYVERNLDKCRLTKNTFKYIEGELRAYPQMRKELEAVKDDVIFTAPEPQEGHSSTPGNPTMQKAIKINNKIYSSPQLRQMQKTVDAIKKVYSRCEPQKRKIIELLYWQNRYTADGLAYQMQVDRSTIYRWRKHIVYEIAIELNYL